MRRKKFYALFLAIIMLTATPAQSFAQPIDNSNVQTTAESDITPDMTSTDSFEDEEVTSDISSNVRSVPTVSGTGSSHEETTTDNNIDEQLLKAKEALKKLTDSKDVAALVNLSDSYDVMSSCDLSAKTVVTVLSGQTVLIKDVEVYDGKVWYYTEFYYNGKPYNGYIERDNLAYSDEDFISFEDTYITDILNKINSSTVARSAASSVPADIAQFPASYQPYLIALKNAHPKWTFVKQPTGVDWDIAVANEMLNARSLVPASSNSSWISGAYGGGWSYASKMILEYCMDPRNFLTEDYIFQFEQLTFNSSYHSAGAVQTMLNSTFMKGNVPGKSTSYAKAFYNIGKDLGVSPFFLSCRVYQEQGAGTSPLISGTYSGYKGYYNYFNVGASGSTVAAVILNGLKAAKSYGWNSAYAALEGGSKIVSNNYILKGQDTLYLQKFNVIGTYYSRYTHQYMQNIFAPKSEGANIQNLYEAAGSLNNTFVFKIPVYGDMDSAVSGQDLSYSVKFNGNGATSGSMTDINCKANTSYTLAGNGFKKKGYTFKTWNTKADGSGVAYANKAKIDNLSTTGGTVTLYARWSKKKYTITYSLDGGTNSGSNPSKYYVTTKTITFANPTRKGYTFGGWYTDSDFENKLTSIAKGSTGNKTLYAKWTANKYYIYFNGNGATSGSIASKKCTYNKNYTLTQNTFERKGYTFAGWNTRADGKGTSYTDKQSVKNILDGSGEKVTLYAQWKKVKYNITYKLNGGINSSSNPSKYYVTTKNITLKAPTKAGYTFVTWNSNKELTSAVNTIAKGSTGNKTFYAEWKPNTYTLKFNRNNSSATGEMYWVNAVYGNEYKLASCAYKLKGYTFTGWNTKADASGTSYADLSTISNLTTSNKGEIYLYAQWKKTNYTITYNLNGGTISDNKKTYTIKTKTFTLQLPTRKGYTFAGWYTDSALTKAITSVKKGSTGNITVYAKWTANKYTVKYIANGGKGTVPDLAATYGVSYKAANNSFKRSGYTFTGWNTKSDGQGTAYGVNVSFKNLSSVDGDYVMLYAQWKKN